MTARIVAGTRKGYSWLQFEYSPQLVEIARGIPGHRKWNADRKVWEFKQSRKTLEYLVHKIPDIKMCYDTEVYWGEVKATEQKALEARSKAAGTQAGDVRDYAFKTTPFQHQVEAFLRCRDLPAYGLFMEQGTGKSKVVVDNAAYLHAKGEIDSLIIACPNSVKTNWVLDELPTHMPEWVEYHAAYWESTPNKAEKAALAALSEVDPPFKILVINIEALSSSRGTQFALEFVRRRRCMLVVDESSRIKTPNAGRSKTCHKLAKLCPYRRILTGTPMTKNPLDLYSQFLALDPEILGYSSFYSFRNRYAVMGGYENKEIIAYQHLEELTEQLQKFTYRVLKKDCLDLPEKIYQRINVPLSPDQKRVYKQMAENMKADIAGQQFSAKIVLTKLMMLQQVNANFLNDEDGNPVAIGKTNPRVDALVDLLEQHAGKAIIWSRWRHEIEEIVAALESQFGKGCAAAFYGGVSSEDRTKIRKEFQAKEADLQFFVGHPAAGGIGLTLTEASLVVYMSNTFSLEDRLQSEDRAHRIGQTRNVTYVDMIAPGTIDARILSALRSKKNIADVVTRDEVSKWI